MKDLATKRKRLKAKIEKSQLLRSRLQVGVIAWVNLIQLTGK